MNPTYSEFSKRVGALMERSARQKAYNSTGVDGPNQLFDFIYSVAEAGHALGEIIYKVIRYKAKKNPTDLEKVAAWAFLVWRKHHELGRRVRRRIRKRQCETGSRRRSTRKNGANKRASSRRTNR